MKKVLWLPSWYPSRTDRFLGDFVERHAKAVSAYQPVFVIYVTKDRSLQKSKPQFECIQQANLNVHIAYYGPQFREGSLLEKLVSLYYYLSLNLKLIHRHVKEYGKPDLVFLHVALKAGIVGLYLKIFRGWRYVLAEHWTLFSRKEKFQKLNPFSRLLILRIINQAEIIFPDSEDLGRRMLQFCPSMKFQYVPNVVDSSIFYHDPEKETTQRRRFIHVSNMNYQKNPEGILRAFMESAKSLPDWDLWMVGPISDELMALVNEHIEYRGRIEFTGLVPYNEVAALVRKSHCLVMFSRYENQPCAIAEALCCGVPVISTDVGGISEIVNPSNGLLIHPDHEDLFSSMLIQMDEKYELFKKPEIAEAAIKKFSYENGGALLSNLLADCINVQKG
jgi:glycosyltransferase involved in cell wall biosynthesis